MVKERKRVLNKKKEKKKEKLETIESAHNQAECCILTGSHQITFTVGSEKH